MSPMLAGAHFAHDLSQLEVGTVLNVWACIGRSFAAASEISCNCHFEESYIQMHLRLEGGQRVQTSQHHEVTESLWSFAMECHQLF